MKNAALPAMQAATSEEIAYFSVDMRSFQSIKGRAPITTAGARTANKNALVGKVACSLVAACCASRRNSVVDAATGTADGVVVGAGAFSVTVIARFSA